MAGSSPRVRAHSMHPHRKGTKERRGRRPGVVGSGNQTKRGPALGTAGASRTLARGGEPLSRCLPALVPPSSPVLSRAVTRRSAGGRSPARDGGSQVRSHGVASLSWPGRACFHHMFSAPSRLLLLVLRMANGSLYALCCALVCALALATADAFLVDITYIESAVANGAVCLDGSPPAYHLARGSGSGQNSWLVHFEGGGWCNNVTTCLQRKRTRLGSSKEMAKQIAFSGILSDTPDYNPDFYNWNKVKVRYCDGSSFTGDVEAVDPTTKLYYRGARIWQAVMEDLLAKGMDKAENALISGCSAGGLTSILHCDRFHDLLPSGARVKCLSDAGFFINEKDVAGVGYIAAFFNDVVTTHGSAKNLPSSCTSMLPPGMCFFPQNEVKQIETPLFILNAAYDSWQVRNILVPGVADRQGKWQSCKHDIDQCSAAQLRVLQGFRDDFLKAVAEQGNSASRGLFINSCYVHCQSEMQELWFSSDSPMLGNTTIADAVGDWFFSRSPFQKIDCPYPCDSTCHNRIYEDPSPSQA